MTAESWSRSGYTCPIPANPADRDPMIRTIESDVHVQVAEHVENTGTPDERVAAITRRVQS